MSQNSVEVIGRACRLPGANSVSEFWDLLVSERCSVSEIGPDRFSKFRYLHPLSGQAGKTYTFRAGVVDDVWGFDPSVFALSPREASQMDPQQRLLLMLVWEALEEAGLTVPDIAGSNIGVFVGNSGSDHSNRFFFDPASSDSFMMTGNTLSLVSNRISYVYDLHGPSFTVDTACSSSLVALDLALKRLQSGEIDTAIVAGVNLLLSPFPFVGFAAASMLSPQGLCRPFDENANGYVRAEGAVVLVLQRGDVFDPCQQKSFGRIVASGINSDGRTSGVALPSSEFQASLLEQIYSEMNFDLNDLAFVEAHGTGTRVGDPAEAFALGKVLGDKRSTPLPIGSVKSNMGHLEPASGLVSVLKSLLSLEHDLFPASLHVETPNPDIPFEELNLALNLKAMPLKHGDDIRYAGINNFGFGGTNAHVLVSDSAPVEPVAKAKVAVAKKSAKAEAPVEAEQRLFVLSAKTEDALRALARSSADVVKNSEDSLADWCKAFGWHRTMLDERLAIVCHDKEALCANLAAFAEGEKSGEMVSATASKASRNPVFVYSGNGSQFAGMGQVAFKQNPDFAAAFVKVDKLFKKLSGWSLETKLFDETLKDELQKTSIAQPLLFAVQVALTTALKAKGLMPGGVMGHSVGEVAAAWASGALTLEQAVRVIYLRSYHQEVVAGTGRMAVIKSSVSATKALLKEEGFAAIEVSAINTDESLTLSGPTDELQRFLKLARKKRLASKMLDINYPFHSKSVEQIREGLLKDLADIVPGKVELPFYSSVTGKILEGGELGGEYWWANVRQPVDFLGATEAAFADGNSQYIEIGPRPILKSYVSEIARDHARSITVTASLQQKADENLDPVLLATGLAFANGLLVDKETVFGPRVKCTLPLPNYPWQLKTFKITPSPEAFDIFNDSAAPHAFLGQQLRPDEHVWSTELDTTLMPYLADHKVDGKVILPGAAFAEMALAAAQQGLKTDRVELRDMDLLQALTLKEDQSVSLLTRLNTDTGVVEIYSRARLVDDDWLLHAKCRVAKIPGELELDCADHDLVAPSLQLESSAEELEALYDISREFGLDFGPNFHRLKYCKRFGDDYIEIVIKPLDQDICQREAISGPYVLHPLDFDASFHGLNTLYSSIDSDADKMAFIPVRFGCLRVYQTGSSVRSARIHVIRSNSRGIKADINLFAEDGSLVASLRDGRFRASALTQRQGLERLTYSYDSIRLALPSGVGADLKLDKDAIRKAISALDYSAPASTDEGYLLLQAAGRRGAYDILRQFANESLEVSEAMLPALQQLEDMQDSANDDDRIDEAVFLKQLFAALLSICETSDLATQGAENWTLAADCVLPEVNQILQLLIGEDARWSAHSIMLNHALHMIPQVLQGSVKDQVKAFLPQDLYSNDLYEQSFSSSPLATAHVEQVKASVAAVLAAWPEGRSLRVLELGVGGAALTKALRPMVEDKGGILVSADSNKLIIDRLRILFANKPGFEAVSVQSDLEALQAYGPFDIVVSANGLQMMHKASSILSELPGLMTDDSLVLFSLSDASVYDNMVFGLATSWFEDTVDPLFPMSFHGDAQDWQNWFKDVGLVGLELSPFFDEESNPILTGAYLLSGFHSNATSSTDEEDLVTLDKALRHCFILSNGADDVEQAFAEQIKGKLSDMDCSQIDVREPSDIKKAVKAIAAMSSSDGLPEIVFLAGAFADKGTTVELCADRLHLLAELFRESADMSLRLWIVAQGGYPASMQSHNIAPVQSGIWAFGRTASNEYSNHDVRLVDFSDQLGMNDRAERLSGLLLEPGEEREILLEGSAQQVVRISRGWKQGADADQKVSAKAASKLYHPRSGSFDRLKWIPTIRRKPAAGEIEIEVVAAGLNFRDVMWAQGLLPEEALEDGFAGPTLGFECSGRVVAIGEGVTDLKINDPVMTLAPASFASHVTVAEGAVLRLSEDFDLVAAATMPVAFLTSFYALDYLARLEEGEWVLIHGAAGAVGLAAIQIAKWRGARIIATAGNNEKRDFLKMLGADHVLDSRSLDFVDQVRAITREADGADREGVDVVLNSLFNEAMERSLELVRPFGRFLELGKRDFYGNTKIGLRPFRRNVSYFGIDADQLLNHRPQRAKQLLAELSDLIKQEQFTPLPYRLFESEDIVDAFRLMQRSGHVGKIVVKAPKPLETSDGDAAFHVESDGHHVLVGGLGGFGFEAALWLAGEGAKSVVLTSRSGKTTPEALVLKKKLAAKGCDLTIKPCDVCDATALDDLLSELRKARPIKGIMHMAAVLDDQLIANMSDGQIDKVLYPKIVGGDNLDRLTRADNLDYFWLFSSVSVLMGNPGQANYVAANSYMDGLARKRRQEGLPALAIGWGAITDVGILARDTQTAEILAKTTGGIEFKAQQALEYLADFLGQMSKENVPASITIAPMNWSYASRNLSILKTPAYQLLMKEASQSASNDQQSIDIAALISGLDPVSARNEIAKILAQEVAVIFRMPVEEINLGRPLADIGMDSLMGMELRMAAQQKFDIEIPMTAIADGATIEDIAARVLERIGKDDEEDSSLSFTEKSLIHQHIGSEGEASVVSEKLNELRKGGM
nr:polyketide synthase [uncultured Cohaesibacter sp.]